MVETPLSWAEIRYQEGETVSHRWIDAKMFIHWVHKGSFPAPTKERMLIHWDIIHQPYQRVKKLLNRCFFAI